MTDRSRPVPKTAVCSVRIHERSALLLDVVDQYTLAPSSLARYEYPALERLASTPARPPGQ